MLVLLLFTVFVGLYVWLITSHWRKEPKGFPKGPRSLIPFLGGMLSAGREPHKYFTELQEKYGKLFAYDVGPNRTIIVNGWEETRDLGSMTEFCGRSTEEKAFLYFCPNQEPHGMMFAQMGPMWHEQKRFTLRNLRDFGYLKEPMEFHLEDEIRDVLDFLKSTGGKPLTLDHQLDTPLANSIWAILIGNKFEKSDPLLKNLQDKIHEDLLLMLALIYFPMFFKIHDWFPSLVPFVSKYIGNRTYTFGYIQQLIDEHKISWTKGEPRDFIDKYLDEIDDEKDPKSSFYGESADLNLLAVIHDLFNGGNETVSHTLKWAVHLFALNPRVQEKMFKEIKSVVGLSRAPTLADRNSLPYTNSVFFEVLRYAVIGPLLPHQVVDDITYKGQFYPKGTHIIYNNYACLHDKEYWGDPEVFRPERFIAEDGTVIRHQPFVPFHFGKRACPGQTLAEAAIFLFLASIAQNIHIIPDPSRPIPTEIKSVYGVTHAPISFPLVFRDRSKAE